MPLALHVTYLMVLSGLIFMPFYQQPILTAVGLSIVVISVVVYFVFVRRSHKPHWCLRLDGRASATTSSASCVLAAWLLHNAQKLFYATYEQRDVNELVLTVKTVSALVADKMPPPTTVVQRF
jgi:hypothetical protein